MFSKIPTLSLNIYYKKCSCLTYYCRETKVSVFMASILMSCVEIVTYVQSYAMCTGRMKTFCQLKTNKIKQNVLLNTKKTCCFPLAYYFISAFKPVEKQCMCMKKEHSFCVCRRKSFI